LRDDPPAFLWAMRCSELSIYVPRFSDECIN
jgi:hypothetical protein